MKRAAIRPDEERALNREEELDSRRYPIAEDMALQCRVWRFERIGWWSLGLIVLLALLGLFSRGPLSRAERATPGGELVLRYQRFERQSAPTELRVQLIAARGGRIWLVLGGDFLRSFAVEGIQPPPAAARSEGAGLALAFETGGAGRAEVHLALRPKRIGPSRSVAAVAGRSLRFGQFIYP